MKYFAPAINIAVLGFVVFSPSLGYPAAMVAIALLVHATSQGPQPSPPAIDTDRLDKIEKTLRQMATSKLVK